jgi:hypothetical protein
MLSAVAASYDKMAPVVLLIQNGVQSLVLVYLIHAKKVSIIVLKKVNANQRMIHVRWLFAKIKKYLPILAVNKIILFHQM